MTILKQLSAMGTFLSLISVVGKTRSEVVKSFTNYIQLAEGRLEKENLPITDDWYLVEEANGNTTILYPNNYMEWDESSAFISKELNAPAFSLHIHDGDLWMYILFVNGQIADQFNPVPDYWDDNLSEESESWKGNATIVEMYLNNIKKADFENYLVQWNIDAEGNEKAYPDDEFGQEHWQMLDFMKKLGLPYPPSNDRNHKGQIFRLTAKTLRSKS